MVRVATFEDQGVSMELIKVFAVGGQDFMAAPRYLLAGGEAALGLEPPPEFRKQLESPEPTPELAGPA